MSVATIQQNNVSQTTSRPVHSFIETVASRIETIGRHLIRYSLVLVLVWIGGMKFTAYEAEGISGLVANSPLMSWAYQVFTTGQFAAILGVTELAIAVLIAIRPISAKWSALGSVLAIGMFLTTLTFLVSTPGVVEPSLGFPAVSRSARAVSYQRLRATGRSRMVRWRSTASGEMTLLEPCRLSARLGLHFYQQAYRSRSLPMSEYPSDIAFSPAVKSDANGEGFS